MLRDGIGAGDELRHIGRSRHEAAGRDTVPSQIRQKNQA